MEAEVPGLDPGEHVIRRLAFSTARRTMTLVITGALAAVLIPVSGVASLVILGIGGVAALAFHGLAKVQWVLTNRRVFPLNGVSSTAGVDLDVVTDVSAVRFRGKVGNITLAVPGRPPLQLRAVLDVEETAAAIRVAAQGARKAVTVDPTAPIEVLRARLASGEISEEDYRRKLELIRS